MPSKSQKQHNLMEAAAHDGSTAVPKDVAQEFVEADKGKDIKSLPERRKKLGLRKGRR